MNETGSTRMQIMTMLKTEGGLTVSEIAERLGVTEMAVRRHMNQLERDQLIVPQLLRKSMGRPSNQYFLTERSEQYFPKMYAGFAMEILKDLEENYGEEMIQSVFKNREKRLLKEHLSDFQGKSLDEKVRRLAELQDEKGYMVKWEKEGEGGLPVC
ncbi:metalloregulator ArsR/SmtB family transcription factor [Thermoactinomyces sp. Gus2-1]|uniref:helix-turn-helix transcriptional regulator n=1 Tax=Thermoactinomyces sp. Gus2-1 TaxID=1535750 RepID=UPI000AF88511|nr:helix-turn-helix domain-containing protein [Thermoactinomyces sp. Gus2-1]